MLLPRKSMKIKPPKALSVKRGRPKVDPAKKARPLQISLAGDLIDFLNNSNMLTRSRFINMAVRTAMEFKKYRSLAYDKCFDCGCDMTAPLNPLDGSKTYVDENGKILDVFVQCEGCGGRSGHRQYDPKKHGIEPEE